MISNELNLVENDDTLFSPTHARRLRTSFPLSATTGVLLYNYSPAPPPSPNPYTFAPYTLISHTPIATSAPQSSILTLLGPSPEFSLTHLQSVEIKQPAVQIARSYTPLPSSDDGTIRLLIKLEPFGEMTRYIFSLPPSSTIELRGPHNEYPLPPADTASRILFLIGGTGAERDLGTSDTAEMRILWAVRRRMGEVGDVGEVVEVVRGAGEDVWGTVGGGSGSGYGGGDKQGGSGGGGEKSA
ncbi:hypothetical protein BDD12DRAFT_901135 [Trichophaea hybrida]|nr:hypothetical protein BDD12DRAFT_901135 [Trichophaea hybrida]